MTSLDSFKQYASEGLKYASVGLKSSVIAAFGGAAAAGVSNMIGRQWMRVDTWHGAAYGAIIGITAYAVNVILNKYLPSPDMTGLVTSNEKHAAVAARQEYVLIGSLLTGGGIAYGLNYLAVFRGYHIAPISAYPEAIALTIASIACVQLAKYHQLTKW